MLEEALSVVSMRTTVTPQQIADAIVFICSHARAHDLGAGDLDLRRHPDAAVTQVRIRFLALVHFYSGQARI